jgi:Zn-dependent peptidase ImmA (M78 family)
MYKFCYSCGTLYNMDINHKEIEFRTLEILDAYDIAKPVVDVAKIAKGEGVEIKEIKMPDEFKGVAGFYDKQSKTIYIEKADPPHRKLFSIAHELGHIILGHQHATVQFRVTHSETPYSKEEKEANSFAKHLLMPDFMLRQYLRNYNLTRADYVTMAKMFGVPVPAMAHSLERLK